MIPTPCAYDSSKAPITGSSQSTAQSRRSSNSATTSRVIHCATIAAGASCRSKTRRRLREISRLEGQRESTHCLEATRPMSETERAELQTQLRIERAATESWRARVAELTQHVERLQTELERARSLGGATRA
jgi:hypothetical protein